MPNNPSDPNCGHRSRGNAFSESMRAARGAMRSAAKRLTCSRSSVTSSGRPKSKSSMDSPSLEIADHGREKTRGLPAGHGAMIERQRQGQHGMDDNLAFDGEDRVADPARAEDAHCRRL